MQTPLLDPNMFESLSLRKEVVLEREEALRIEIRELDDSDKKRFHEKFSLAVKDPDTYAVLNFFFVAGLHHFYLAKILRGTINLVVFAIGVISLFLNAIGFGALLIGVILLIELPALFRAQLIVGHYNNELSSELLEQIKSDNLGLIER